MTLLDLMTSPSVVEARRSGRLRVVSTIHPRMAEYRALLVARGPRTDQDAALSLGKPLSVINAIRGDWKSYAEHAGIDNPVQAAGRERKTWATGRHTSRVRWTWRGL